MNNIAGEHCELFPSEGVFEDAGDLRLERGAYHWTK
jgi:hypothetical protein